MNKISIYISIFMFILLLFSIAYCFFRNWRAEAKKNKDLKTVLKETQDNLVYIIKHQSELKQIEKDEGITQKQIEQAETDEEIFNIINTIVNHNNELCNE